jgi:hypothetical protein
MDEMGYKLMWEIRRSQGFPQFRVVATAQRYIEPRFQAFQHQPFLEASAHQRAVEGRGTLEKTKKQTENVFEET